MTISPESLDFGDIFMGGSGGEDPRRWRKKTACCLPCLTASDIRRRADTQVGPYPLFAALPFPYRMVGAHLYVRPAGNGKGRPRGPPVQIVDFLQISAARHRKVTPETAEPVISSQNRCCFVSMDAQITRAHTAIPAGTAQPPRK